MNFDYLFAQRNGKLNSLPSSREEAKALEASKYFTGQRCVRNHLTFRYTSNGACSECVSEKSMLQYKPKKKEQHRPSIKRRIDDLMFEKQIQKLEGGEL